MSRGGGRVAEGRLIASGPGTTTLRRDTGKDGEVGIGT